MVWRIDNARVEQLRVSLIDRFVPSFAWTTKPLAATAHMIADLRAYGRVYEQNAELRRELQRMQGWREVALQLEQKNARLLALNNVRLNPRMTFVTGEVMADAGSPFRQSVMVNVGRLDGVVDGSAVMDGLGLVGRIAGVGERSARVILLGDGSMRVPATVRPSGQRAMVSRRQRRDAGARLRRGADEVKPGDQVVSSGDGGLYPPDIVIGRVVVGPDGRQRVRLAADTRRLDFVRVVRGLPPAPVEGPGGLIGPLAAPARGRGRRGARNERAARPAGRRRDRACCSGSASLSVLAVMIPLGPGGALVAPDLLYCLLVAWVVRRPARTPLWRVVALGLFADVMLSRPLGLGALGLMLVVETFRRRALLFHGAPFLLEWGAAVAAFARDARSAMHLALALVLVAPPGLGAVAAPPAGDRDRLPAGGARADLVPAGSRAARRRGLPAGAAAMRPPVKAPPPRITRRGLMLLGIQAGAVGALAWRMRDLQIRQNEHFSLLAEENRVNLRLIPPARGVITDRHGPAARRQPAELPHRHGARAGRRRRGGARPARADRRHPARPARAGAEGDGEPQRLRAGRRRRAPDLGRHRAGRRERADPAGGDPRGRPQPHLSRRPSHRARRRLRRAGVARATSPRWRTPTRCCKSRASRSARPGSRPRPRRSCAARPGR